MPHSVLFRLLLVAGAAVASLVAGAAVAPAALADEKPTPPGLSSPPSVAVLNAVPLTNPHGRKLR